MLEPILLRPPELVVLRIFPKKESFDDVLIVKPFAEAARAGNTNLE